MSTCSASSPLSDCNIDYSLPASGKPVADWIVGGLFTFFFICVCYGATIAFKRKKTIRLPWINLWFFTGFRASGYLIRAWVDNNQPQPDWTFSRAKQWVILLTTSYSIISAGTTIFLIYIGSLAVAFRRCTTNACPPYDEIKEKRILKHESIGMWIFRYLIVALAVIGIVGSLRQFDYYWLDYNQGILLRKIPGYAQPIFTFVILIYINYLYLCSSSTRKSRKLCLRAWSILINIIPIALISQIFNLIRIYNGLDKPVNADPNYAYLLQVLPDLLMIFILLIANFDYAFDYERI